MTMIALLATAALSVLSAGAPDTAPAPAAAATIMPAAKAPTSRYVVQYDQKHDRYCVRDRDATPVTGSMLVRTQCKTRTDWAAEGLNISGTR